MIKIEATTLEEAYEKASNQLECSITDLNFEVVQHPSGGFLGLWKKSAIIIATCKASYRPREKKAPFEPRKQKPFAKEVKSYAPEPNEVKVTPKEEPTFQSESHDHQDIFNNFFSNKTKTPTQHAEKEHKSPTHQAIPHTLTKEVESQIRAMFKLTCFDINEVKVSAYDATTLLIEFDGKDAALLIGKDGYRYKAISYMLFNWINPKYGLMIRLEIAQFLKNQEEMIENYLNTLTEKIEKNPKSQTKQLDGILLHIALTKLRERYPHKYIAIKSQGDKRFIIINDFNKEY